MTDIPETIGRYRVERVLAQGAMGVVYRGYDPEIDRAVAIKLVRADLIAGNERDDYVARLRQEARAAGRCAHSNIVALYDCAVHDGNPFLAMEYVAGENLAQAFDRGARYTPAEAVAIIAQVLDALAYAHERGIVHRDIKPANIMLAEDGTVKVADFGISRLPGSELTAAGSIIGTPSYMSPEQCRGEPTDPRSDLFSVGAVLFQLLTGEKPFPGKSVTEIIHKLITEEPPDLLERTTAIPAGLCAAVRRALAKPAEARFATARAMTAALRQGLAGVAAAEADDGTVVDTSAGLSASAPTQVGREGAPPLSLGLTRFVFNVLVSFYLSPLLAVEIWYNTIATGAQSDIHYFAALATGLLLCVAFYSVLTDRGTASVATAQRRRADAADHVSGFASLAPYESFYCAVLAGFAGAAWYALHALNRDSTGWLAVATLVWSFVSLAVLFLSVLQLWQIKSGRLVELRYKLAETASVK